MTFNVVDFFGFQEIGKPSMNRSGQIAFLGAVTGEGLIDVRSLFFWDPVEDELQKTLGAGDVFDVAGVDDDPDLRTVVDVLGFGANKTSPVSSPFNNDAEMVASVVVENEAGVQSNMVVIVEPASATCTAEFDGSGGLDVPISSPSRPRSSPRTQPRT